MDVVGKPLLWHLLQRLQRAREIEQIVVATSDRDIDDPIAVVAEVAGAFVFRGSESDVVSRFYGAAKCSGANPILRITADCPLIDPEIVDKVLRRLRDTKADYVTTDLTPTYPNGMGCEAFTFAALERCFQETASGNRENVTEHIRKPASGFRLETIEGQPGINHYRLTVDVHEDFELVRRILEHFLPARPQFGLQDIIDHLQQNPETAELNANVRQKTGPHASAER